MALTQYTGLTPTAADVVSVFYGGTQVLATIYADSLSTPLGNPFTSDAISGQYRYWAEFAVYDEVITVAGQPLPPVAPPDAAFAIVAIQSGNSVPATRKGDTLALIEGSGITLTGDTVAKTITIAASGGGTGTPSATVAALTGSAVVGVSTDYSRGDHAHADVNRPATGEKAALAGTSGTPGGGNAYVTDADARNTNARTPSAHETTHRSAGSDPLSVVNLAGYPGGTTTFLRADGSFAAPAIGSYVLIQEITCDGTTTTINFAAIPGSYRHLKIIFTGRVTSAGSANHDIYAQFNGDTAANYDKQIVFAAGTTASAAQSNGVATPVIFAAPEASVTAGLSGGGEWLIPYYAATTFDKTSTALSTSKSANSAGGCVVVSSAIHWRSTVAITSILFGVATSGNFVSGSKFSLYGIA